MRSGNGSSSRLPLFLGGGCVLVGLAVVGLVACGLLFAVLAGGARGASPRPQPGPMPTRGAPGAPPGLPPGPAQPGPGQPGAPPEGQPGGPAAPQPGAPSGPQPGAPSSPQRGFTVVYAGGFTCDLHTNQCQPRSGGGVTQVIPQGDGTIVLQSEGHALRVRPDCALVDQPAYTFFPCPFFPNVRGFQGVLFNQGQLVPLPTPFQFTHIDTDFDQDGVVNEPGYASIGTGSLAFVAYREDGLIKFAGYIVETENYAWLYVFLYQIR